MKSRLNIVIPTFNSEKTLAVALSSLTSLNRDLIKVMVIDGDSSDSTRKIVEKYQNIIDLFISEKDDGVYDAMNKGIYNADDKALIYFLGSDDEFLLANNDVQQILTDSKKYQCHLYGNVLLDGAKRYCGHFSRYKLSVKNICHQAIFYNSEIDDIRFNVKYKMWADWDLNIRVFRNLRYIEKDIANYSTLGFSNQTPSDVAFVEDSRPMVKKHLGGDALIFRDLYEGSKKLIKTVVK